jgi:hypothetical protein
MKPMKSVLPRIAFYLDRRDEVPNQELAAELAQADNRLGIREIAENLSNKNPNIRADCLKVLYEVGYIRPELIADHVEAILALLHEKNNRLVWGAMIALSTIAELKSAAIGRHSEEIMRIMENGSVITIDNGVKILAGVASKEPRLRGNLLAFLFDHLKSCRPKDVPQHSEKTLVAIDRQSRAQFITILTGRLPELSPSQAKRVSKVISSAGT